VYGEGNRAPLENCGRNLVFWQVALTGRYAMAGAAAVFLLLLLGSGVAVPPRVAQIIRAPSEDDTPHLHPHACSRCGSCFPEILGNPAYVPAGEHGRGGSRLFAVCRDAGGGKASPGVDRRGWLPQASDARDVIRRLEADHANERGDEWHRGGSTLVRSGRVHASTNALLLSGRARYHRPV